jgi:ABC-type amino acid transport system permease subunit
MTREATVTRDACGRLPLRNRFSDPHIRFEPFRGHETFPSMVAGTLSMRIVLIIFFIAIIASLGSALYDMVGQRHTGGAPDKRMARALAIRVGLSVTAFVLLMAGYYFGLIPAQR